MEKIRNRHLILIIIMFLASVLVNFLTYETYHKAETGIQAIEKIPIKIGKWQGKDVTLDGQIYKFLETKSIIHRNYILNGKNVFLSIVYYPETKVDFHAPEACLAGQGIQISKNTKAIFIKYNGKKVKVKLNQLVRQNNNSNELIYYFYKAGDFIGQSYIKLRFTLAINKLSNNKKSGALIRVSTPVLMDDEQKTEKILINFIEQLYPFVTKYL